MNREQTILEDFYTHIFNGGLTTKIITDAVKYNNDFVSRSYKLQFRLHCLDFPMTVTAPLFSVAQVYDLIKALERTLEHMIDNSDELSRDHATAGNRVYVRGGEKADGSVASDDDAVAFVNAHIARLKSK